ncbi:MAG TPA: alpha/beta fold hydrolase [Candidatus Kapabacteria bacterium]|nr:alpha/beta fold hydrolase [Candidatus Kapabacteria bacterium]
MTHSRSFLIIAFLLVLASSLQAQEKEYIALGKEFIKLFEEKQFAECMPFVDASIKDKLTVTSLESIHTQIHSKLGKLVKQQGELFEDDTTYQLVYIGCEFENQKLDYKIVFNPQKKLIGFFLVAPVEKVQYSLPPYAHLDSIIEIPMVITSDTFKLAATLTIPKSANHPPIVVMVQGSGPQDRDESVHANKPFKDLAFGLAAHGIATLRYDKRTYVYSSATSLDIARLTPKQEVTDDALAAIKFMRYQLDLDTSRIYLLGHSLGAMMAPRIAAEDKRLAGMIMMAAPARPFEDVLLDQMEFLLPQQLAKQKADSQLANIRQTIKKVKAHNYKDTTSSSALLGLSPAYWDYLRKYDQIKTAKSLTTPMLVLQGGKDYQVSKKDFHLWKESLVTNDNVSFEYFDNLYHLFMIGAGTYTDYDAPSHIPMPVIDRIAWWVKNH